MKQKMKFGVALMATLIFVLVGAFTCSAGHTSACNTDHYEVFINAQYLKVKCVDCSYTLPQKVSYTLIDKSTRCLESNIKVTESNKWTEKGYPAYTLVYQGTDGTDYPLSCEKPTEAGTYQVRLTTVEAYEAYKTAAETNPAAELKLATPVKTVKFVHHNYTYTATENGITAKCKECGETCEITYAIEPGTCFCSGQFTPSLDDAAWKNACAADCMLVYENLTLGNGTYTDQVPTEAGVYGIRIALASEWAAYQSAGTAMSTLQQVPAAVTLTEHAWAYESDSDSITASCIFCDAEASVHLDVTSAFDKYAIGSAQYDVCWENNWNKYDVLPKVKTIYEGTGIPAGGTEVKPTAEGIYNARLVVETANGRILSTEKHTFYLAASSPTYPYIYSNRDIPNFDEPEYKNGFYQVGTLSQLLWCVFHQTNDMQIDITADIIVNPICIRDNTAYLVAGQQMCYWPGFGQDEAQPFSGIIRGNGHTIYGLIDSANYATGLIQYGKNVTITDLTIRNSYLFGNDVGAFFGVYKADRDEDSTVLRNCNSVGNYITGNSSIGGLIGLLYTASTNAGTVVLENCTNTSTVKGYWAGGIIGASAGAGPLHNATFSGLINTGAVTATGRDAGGIIGQLNVLSEHTVNFENCENVGSGDVNLITGAESAGGIIGNFTAQAFPSDHAYLNLTKCFSSSNMSSGSKYPSAMIGKLNSNCYNYGYLKFSQCYYSKSSYITPYAVWMPTAEVAYLTAGRVGEVCNTLGHQVLPCSTGADGSSYRACVICRSDVTAYKAYNPDNKASRDENSLFNMQNGEIVCAENFNIQVTADGYDGYVMVFKAYNGQSVDYTDVKPTDVGTYSVQLVPSAEWLAYQNSKTPMVNLTEPIFVTLICHHWNYSADEYSLYADCFYCGEHASATANVSTVFEAMRNETASDLNFELYYEENWSVHSDLPPYYAIYDGKEYNDDGTVTVYQRALVKPQSAGNYSVRLALLADSNDPDSATVYTKSKIFYLANKTEKMTVYDYNLRTYNDQQILNFAKPAFKDGYYQVGSLEELLWCVYNSCSDMHINITNDIVVNPATVVGDNIYVASFDQIYKWQGFGTESNPFSGIILGNGHSIYGMIAGWEENDNNPHGFINYGKNVTICDLSICNSNFWGSDSAPFIARYTENNNCLHYVLCDCFSLGNRMWADDSAGGFVGRVYTNVKGEVGYEIYRNCVNTSEVNGSKNSGGIIGVFSIPSSITISLQPSLYANVDKQPVNTMLLDCVNLGEIYSAKNGGGMVGNLTIQPRYVAVLRNCVNTGEVYGSENLGGMIGYYDGSYRSDSEKGQLQLTDNFNAGSIHWLGETPFESGVHVTAMVGSLTGRPFYQGTIVTSGNHYENNIGKAFPDDIQYAGFDETTPFVSEYVKNEHVICNKYGHILLPYYVNVVSAGCETDGSMELVCAVCGDVIEHKAVLGHGHYYEMGNYGLKCIHCGSSPNTGSMFGESNWVVPAAAAVVLVGAAGNWLIVKKKRKSTAAKQTE